MRIVRLVPGIVRAAAVSASLAVATPVFAQDSTVAASCATVAEIVNLPPVDLRALPPQTRIDSAQLPLPGRQRTDVQRPSALLPLYGSLMALQALDIHSTRRVIDAGAGREANPAMRDVVHNSAAFVAVKAGATAGVIWASEKMWKKNRKVAIIFTSLVNVAMAAVVANNYRVGR